MARTGIGKSEVQRARDRLLARRTHPSIDAVRAELGHTGSKTTIQRYLRELEEEEGSSLDRTAAVSAAIQELVQRLAARLGEEAGAQVVAQREQYEAQLRERDEQLAQQHREAEALAGQLRQTEMMLQAEQTTHATTRQALAEAHTAHERLTQQVTDLTDRLADNEAHRQSLEEKHRIMLADIHEALAAFSERIGRTEADHGYVAFVHIGGDAQAAGGRHVEHAGEAHALKLDGLKVAAAR